VEPMFTQERERVRPAREPRPRHQKSSAHGDADRFPVERIAAVGVEQDSFGAKCGRVAEDRAILS
jgi:hypothetical protein